jgi:4-amino-4-deoxy-L-arabinose transferase-like glycosyltransferase
MKIFLNISDLLRDFCRLERGKAAWVCFIGLFMLTGILGHDPWKQDETYSFGIIYHFYATNSWIIPSNAGVPFMEKPPIYYWTSVLLCKVFGGMLELPDAARLASFFYMLVAVYFISKSAWVLDEKRIKESRWIAILLFLSTVNDG